MKANELRIGNYVQYPNLKKPIRVSFIDTTETNTTRTQPIPLTEEWLLKFGFNSDWSKILTKQIEGNTFELRFDKTDKIIVLDVNINYEETSLEFKHIKYIHQLQNLYFALTGEELEIK